MQSPRLAETPDRTSGYYYAFSSITKYNQRLVGLLENLLHLQESLLKTAQNTQIASSSHPRSYLINQDREEEKSSDSSGSLRNHEANIGPIFNEAISAPLQRSPTDFPPLKTYEYNFKLTTIRFVEELNTASMNSSLSIVKGVISLIALASLAVLAKSLLATAGWLALGYFSFSFFAQEAKGYYAALGEAHTAFNQGKFKDYRLENGALEPTKTLQIRFFSGFFAPYFELHCDY